MREKHTARCDLQLPECNQDDARVGQQSAYKVIVRTRQNKEERGSQSFKCLRTGNLVHEMPRANMTTRPTWTARIETIPTGRYKSMRARHPVHHCKQLEINTVLIMSRQFTYTRWSSHILSYNVRGFVTGPGMF